MTRLHHTSRMAERTSLRDHFLIAMPGLADPNFFHAVVYLCEHDEEGAMGLVVNRPLDLTLGEIFEQMGIEASDEAAAGQAVYFGGPVQCERGFVIHRPHGDWESSLSVSDEVAVTSSRDILVSIASGRGPRDSLVALGYAGWGPGQLEQELVDNAWLSVESDPAILFGTADEERWQAAAARGGIDPTLLSGEIGHA